MRQAWVVALFALQVPFAAYAPLARSQGAGNDALGWLERIYSATKTLSYSGTFIYQQGTNWETSRIARQVATNGAPQERVVALDGSPREIIRTADEVRCYLPGANTIKVERMAAERTLLPIVPTAIRGLAEHYNVTRGETVRIAGFECQSIELTPKDKLRYGHRFWVDIASGMVLKAQTLDTSNQVVEQFMFTQLRIGSVPRRELETRLNSKGWKVEHSGATPANLAEAGWSLERMPPGFRKLTEMRRTFSTAGEAGQIVLSDGLAAVSLFIERLREDHAATPLGRSHQGAVNIFTLKLADHLVTAVGEVPPDAVQTIAQSLRYRRP